MKEAEKQTRWTILDFPVEIREKIKLFAKEKGYKIPRAIEELTKRELEKWEKSKQ